MARRLFALLLTLTLSVSAVPAVAQSDTGEIDIVVQNTATKAPVALARVLLDGPIITSEFTGENGRVRFTDVPDGIYRARVFARGFQAVTSQDFEVTNGRLVTVTVALAQSSSANLRTIASVVAKSTASVATNSIDQNSAQRRLSDTLADALGKLSGVNVSTSSSDSDATQTVSLEGQDASQTALSMDGIPLNAPGSAGDLRAIGTDLFTRSTVSFGPQLGGLAGGVNFSSLEPTLTWQSEFSLSAGSNGKNNYSFGESGTAGKFGVAFMHAYRLNPSLLDGMRFEDTSGLDYSHEGDSQQIGSMVKVRYEPDQAQTLTGTFMHTVNGSQLVCAQVTGPLPCGYGPNNSSQSDFKLYALTDNALIGDTQVQASLYGMRMDATRNELARYVAGEAQPTGTSQAIDTNGISLNATLPARDRHTISFSGYATSSNSSFTPLVAQAQPFVFAGQKTSYAAFTVNDSIRANTKLRFNDSIGVSRASNAQSSLLVGLGTQWSPTPDDTFAFNYNLGGSAPHPGRFGLLSDPAQLRFDCNGEVAYGNAPGDEPAASSSTSVRVSATHRTRLGSMSASLYRQVQRNIVLPTQVNGTALGSTIFPSGYFETAYSDFENACQAPLSFPSAQMAQNVYFSTPIGGVSRVYEGAQLAGYFTLGRLVVQPYYDIQVGKALTNDPRVNNPFSITIPGSQLPNVPLHRAGLTLDYKSPGSAIEWLADAHYTSANNPQNLPAYTIVDAGANAHLHNGDLTFAVSNVFDTYAGTFAGSQWAVPYTTLGGGTIATIARPNTPRQLSVTYTVRLGRGASIASSRGALALEPSAEGGADGPGGRGGRGGFRQFAQPLPQTPPADPFALSTGARCSADAQKTAQPILGALKSYVATIQSLKTANGVPASVPPPSIPGLTLEYHPMGQTFALAIALTGSSQLRSLFGCTQFHITDEQTAQQRTLYVPAGGGAMFFRPVVAFMPSVGLYFVRRPPQANSESFRLYRLPASPPAAPFAVHNISSTCTATMHASALAALAQLQGHFANGSAAPAWTITQHTGSAGAWFSLEPADISTIPAILSCGRVAAANRDDLTKLGWDGERPPTLNYNHALGLYILMGGMGRPQPGATPRP